MQLMIITFNILLGKFGRNIDFVVSFSGKMGIENYKLNITNRLLIKRENYSYMSLSMYNTLSTTNVLIYCLDDNLFVIFNL